MLLVMGYLINKLINLITNASKKLLPLTSPFFFNSFVNNGLFKAILVCLVCLVDGYWLSYE
jgi:hypothetical protein